MKYKAVFEHIQNLIPKDDVDPEMTCRKIIHEYFKHDSNTLIKAYQGTLFGENSHRFRTRVINKFEIDDYYIPIALAEIFKVNILVVDRDNSLLDFYPAGKGFSRNKTGSYGHFRTGDKSSETPTIIIERDGINHWAAIDEFLTGWDDYYEHQTEATPLPDRYTLLEDNETQKFIASRKDVSLDKKYENFEADIERIRKTDNYLYRQLYKLYLNGFPLLAMHEFVDGIPGDSPQQLALLAEHLKSCLQMYVESRDPLLAQEPLQKAVNSALDYTHGAEVKLAMLGELMGLTIQVQHKGLNDEEYKYVLYEASQSDKVISLTYHQKTETWSYDGVTMPSVFACFAQHLHTQVFNAVTDLEDKEDKVDRTETDHQYALETMPFRTSKIDFWSEGQKKQVINKSKQLCEEHKALERERIELMNTIDSPEWYDQEANIEKLDQFFSKAVDFMHAWWEIVEDLCDNDPANIAQLAGDQGFEYIKMFFYPSLYETYAYLLRCKSYMTESRDDGRHILHQPNVESTREWQALFYQPETIQFRWREKFNSFTKKITPEIREYMFNNEFGGDCRYKAYSTPDEDSKTLYYPREPDSKPTLGFTK